MNGLREHLSKPDLATLRQQLKDLTQYRNEVITFCNELIREMNVAYDDEAFELAREIAKLDPPVIPVRTEQPKTTRTRRPRKTTLDLTGTEDWTLEELDHFRSLMQAATGR